MSIAKTESLVFLIGSLSKAEKRHFKLFASRLESNREGLFMMIYDVIEEKNLLKDEDILSHLDNLSTSQYANAKRHLFSQILKSLRLLHSSRDLQMSLYRDIDYAQLLYKKGLYSEAEQVFKKLDTEEALHKLLLLDVYESMPLIHNKKASPKFLAGHSYEDFKNEYDWQWTIEKVLLESKVLGIKIDFIRNERESLIFEHQIMNLLYRTQDILGIEKRKMVACFLKGQKCFLEGDFVLAYLNFGRTLYLLENTSDVISRKLLFDVYSYILKALFFLKSPYRFDHFYKKMKATFKIEDVSILPSGLKLDILNFQVKNALLSKKYRFVEILEDYEENDLNKYIEYLYYLACVFAYKGEYEKAIDCLNKLINLNYQTKDFITYARLLAVMCHFRLSHFEYVGNTITSVRNHFVQNGLLSKTSEATFVLLRKGVRAMNFGMKDVINEYIEKITPYSQTKYEKIPFLYFDFINWFESIKRDITVEKTIRY